jgi:hypothetical protein
LLLLLGVGPRFCHALKQPSQLHHMLQLQQHPLLCWYLGFQLLLQVSPVHQPPRQQQQQHMGLAPAHRTLLLQLLGQQRSCSAAGPLVELQALLLPLHSLDLSQSQPTLAHRRRCCCCCYCWCCAQLHLLNLPQVWQVALAPQDCACTKVP